MRINGRKKHIISLLIYILVISSITSNYFIITASGVESLNLTLVFYDDWIPGNAFGFPGYVNSGNFTTREKDDILIISRIPEKTDVVTLCYYNEGKISVDTSFDCDYSQSYQSTVADFDGNGDLELFTSEDWSSTLGDHIGSLHRIYDIGDFAFARNTSFFYNNPNSILDRMTHFDYNDTGDDEIILATWDSSKTTEEIRIYDYDNGALVSITNISYEITSSDFYFRTLAFVGIGDFNGDTNKEIITVSQWNTISSPGVFSTSYELYSLNENTGNISHQSTGLLNVLGTSLTVEITDIDQDMTDELLIYYDKIYSPKLVLYDLSSLYPIEKKILLRPQSSYPSTGWFANSVLISDLNNDSIIEIVFAELNIDYDNGFAGRYEIYSYANSVIESVLLQEISNPPIASTISDVDDFYDLEIISVFNDYSLDNYITKGGMEIWSAGIRSTGNSSQTNNAIALIFLFIMPITLSAYFQKKMVNYRKKS